MHSNALKKLRDRWKVYGQLAAGEIQTEQFIRLHPDLAREIVHSPAGGSVEASGRDATHLLPALRRGLLTDTRDALHDVSLGSVHRFGIRAFEVIDDVALLPICRHPLDSTTPDEATSAIEELDKIQHGAATRIDQQSEPDEAETKGLEPWKVELLDELCLLQDGWARAVEARELNLNDHDAMAWGRAFGVEHANAKSAWAAYDDLVESMKARLRAETLRFADVLETRLTADPHKDWTELMRRWRTAPMFRADAEFAPEAAEEGLRVIRERLTGWPPPEVVLDLSTPEKRRQAIEAYITEVLEKTGRKISRKQIWRHYDYDDRTEFERWQRMHKPPNRKFERLMKDLLTKKPHLTQIRQPTP